MLERRLVDIYKRGPLYTFQVLFAAESFGDLLSRYKYLYLTSRQDRALVDDVETLREPRGQRAEQHPRRARPARPHARGAGGRVRQVQPIWRGRGSAGSQSLQQLGEEHRAPAHRAAEGRGPAQRRARRARAGPPRRGRPRRRARRRRARPARSPPPISASSTGRSRGRSSTASAETRCRAEASSAGTASGSPRAVGTPVKAVEAGKVRLVGQFGTYGLTIVLEHGNGYYSVYSHLQTRRASSSARPVAKGDVDRHGRAARTPTTGRTCTSRSAEKTRWRSIRPTWLQEAVASHAHSALPIRSPDCSRPAHERRLDQREEIVRLSDGGMGIGDDAGAEHADARRTRAATRRAAPAPAHRAVRASGAVSGSTMANSSPP